MHHISLFLKLFSSPFGRFSIFKCFMGNVLWEMSWVWYCLFVL